MSTNDQEKTEPEIQAELPLEPLPPVTKVPAAETSPFTPQHQYMKMSPPPGLEDLAAAMQPDGEVDADAFIKAQSEFIRAQQEFLERATPTDAEYIMALRAFSHAQGKFIRATQDLLAQMGVL